MEADVGDDDDPGRAAKSCDARSPPLKRRQGRLVPGLAAAGDRESGQDLLPPAADRQPRGRSQKAPIYSSISSLTRIVPGANVRPGTRQAYLQ